MITPGRDDAFTFRLLGDMTPYRGNVVFLVEGPFETGERARVLKVYRRRRSRAQELASGIAHRFFEKKRGVTARARCETERLLLDHWSDSGFDVPRRIEDAPPAGLGPYALWMEHCPGRTLFEHVLDESVAWPDRRALISRFAADVGKRESRALAQRDPRLVHEHASLQHVLVSGERLVHVDLEGGYQDRMDPKEAVSLELAGYLRSLRRCTGERFDDALSVFVTEHAHRDVLRSAAGLAVRSPSIARRLRRLQDRLKRGPEGKVFVMRRLLEVVDGPRP